MGSSGPASISSLSCNAFSGRSAASLPSTFTVVDTVTLWTRSTTKICLRTKSWNFWSCWTSPSLSTWWGTAWGEGWLFGSRRCTETFFGRWLWLLRWGCPAWRRGRRGLWSWLWASSKNCRTPCMGATCTSTSYRSTFGEWSKRLTGGGRTNRPNVSSGSKPIIQKGLKRRSETRCQRPPHRPSWTLKWTG